MFLALYLGKIDDDDDNDDDDDDDDDDDGDEDDKLFVWYDWPMKGI